MARRDPNEATFSKPEPGPPEAEEQEQSEQSLGLIDRLRAGLVELDDLQTMRRRHAQLGRLLQAKGLAFFRQNGGQSSTKVRANGKAEQKKT